MFQPHKATEPAVGFFAVVFADNAPLAVFEAPANAILISPAARATPCKTGCVHQRALKVAA